jgi:hypothetical protein
MPVLVVVVLLITAPAVLAGDDSHITVHVRQVTIPWVFPPPEGMSGSICGEIPAGVSINPDDLGSNRLKLSTRKNLPDGTNRTTIYDLVTGTASNASGGRYQFVYLNIATLDFDGATVRVRMQDAFRLKGADVNYRVSFDWRWAYATNQLDVTRVKDSTGRTIDIAISPFPFATNDGVHEDPSIIPGSWQQVKTQGDPFDCDPL